MCPARRRLSWYVRSESRDAVDARQCGAKRRADLRPNIAKRIITQLGGKLASAADGDAVFYFELSSLASLTRADAARHEGFKGRSDRDLVAHSSH